MLQIPTVRIFLIAAGAAAFLALVSTSQTYFTMLDHGHSFARMFTWQLLCWSFWALVAPWIVRTSARYGFFRLVLLGAALTAIQSALVVLYTVWLSPYTPVISYTYTQAFRVTWQFRMLIGPVVFGLLVVGGRALAVYERAKRLELRESQLEGEVMRAQLDALRLEIQPHFLFNTLNSIAALIRLNDNAAALTMLVKLSELMRSRLDRPAGQLGRLADEVTLVKRYIDIQRARFGDRLDVAFRIDETCEGVEVPTFLLQPLVENAVRHGVAPEARRCHLEIGASPDRANGVRLWVSDDGAGLPPGFDLGTHSGTGLRNTSSRIKRLYGQAATLTVGRNQPAGTIVELTLPRTLAAPAMELA